MRYNFALPRSLVEYPVSYKIPGEFNLEHVQYSFQNFVNLLSPKSDQHQISSHNVNTQSRKKGHEN